MKKNDKLITIFSVIAVVGLFLSALISACCGGVFYSEDVIAFPETMDIGPYHFYKQSTSEFEIIYFAGCTEVGALNYAESTALENKIESILRKEYKSSRYGYYAYIKNEYNPDGIYGIKIRIKDIVSKMEKETAIRIEEERQHQELLDRYVNF